jgi:hypothetical protein
LVLGGGMAGMLAARVLGRHLRASDGHRTSRPRPRRLFDNLTAEHTELNLVCQLITPDLLAAYEVLILQPRMAAGLFDKMAGKSKSNSVWSGAQFMPKARLNCGRSRPTTVVRFSFCR